MAHLTNTHRSNNFDFIRLAAALSVLFSHQFALHALPEPLVLRYQTLGGFAVMVFFAVSGYLITGSWQRDPNLRRYAIRRLLRIWPGLACTVLLCALVLGPLVTEIPLSAYFSDPTTHSYFRSLYFSIQPFLPGVFPHSPLAYIPNGVLWTIPIELRCYVYLAVLGILGILRYRWALLALLAATAVWYYGIHGAEAVFLADHTHLFEVEYATFFFAGSCLYYFKDVWDRPRAKLIAAAIVIGVGAVAYLADHPLIAAFIFVPYLVVAFGTSSFPVIHRFGRFGDLSYGVYIYAFPIQQTVIWATPGWGFYEHLLLAIPSVLLMAWLSWHLLENVALQYKPR
ncbi:acyltransferase [Luteibacter sp. 329MFSha]|uniref:acyltransferase family protein n=1 Tax=Luteibacter sp. 329MFSha TaxID=1798239 RepID=UPI0008BE5AB7|nr:acyltransferase [Luteibacter sp. 329MFSha]SEW16792.1 Peptidoglycan/LPS O-acetylase OafA/YrhL, contains acyltransferase and SGNH-hydrolase domains [Luteibacter sp. 329MFSha]